MKYLLILGVLLFEIANARDLEVQWSRYDGNTDTTDFSFIEPWLNVTLKPGERVRIFERYDDDSVYIWFATYTGDKKNVSFQLDGPSRLVHGLKKEGKELILPTYSDNMNETDRTGSATSDMNANDIQDGSISETKQPTDNGINSAVNAGIAAGATQGIAMAIYRGLIMSHSEQKALEKLNAETRANIDRANAAAGRIDAKSVEAYKNLANSLSHVYGRKLDDVFNVNLATKGDNYNYKSPAGDFQSRVAETRHMLNSVSTRTADDAFKKDVGLEMTEVADEAYADGQKSEGELALHIAQQIGDMLIGWDPITGPIRDGYEAITGRNLLTGEKLGTVDRAFAVVGIVTFGWGSKVGKFVRGLKTMQEWAKRVNEMGDSVQYSTKLYEYYVRDRSHTAGRVFDGVRNAYGRYKRGFEHSLLSDPDAMLGLADDVNAAWGNIDDHVISPMESEALTAQLEGAYRPPTKDLLGSFDDPSKVRSMWLDKGTILYRAEDVNGQNVFGKVQRGSILHVEELNKLKAKYPGLKNIKYYQLQASTPVVAGKAQTGSMVQYLMPFNQNLVNKTAKEIPLEDLLKQ